MGGWRETAAVAMGEIQRGLASLEQVAPTPPERGYQWFCNGCPFVTHSTEAAEDHARETFEGDYFPHILYERESREKPRNRRRVHAEAGERMTIVRVTRRRR